MLTAKELLGRAQALEPQLVEWRRTLHRHPEVGFDLTQTKALVKKALTEMGYEPKDCGKAGVIALAGGKKPGKTILLRGDMDALPIQEESGVDFASEVPGKMHGCSAPVSPARGSLAGRNPPLGAGAASAATAAAGAPAPLPLPSNPSRSSFQISSLFLYLA